MKDKSELIPGRDRDAASTLGEVRSLTGHLARLGVLGTHQAAVEMRQESVRTARLTAGEDPDQADPTSHDWRSGAAFVIAAMTNALTEMIPGPGQPGYVEPTEPPN